MAREYSERITVTLSDLINIEDAEDAMFDYITGDLDDAELSKSLSAVSTCLSVFLQYTVAGAVSCCAGLVSGLLSASEKETVIRLMNAGYKDLREKKRFLRQNTQYDMIEIRTPFIEFSTDNGNIRYISGKSVYVRCHIKGKGWQTV